MLSVRCNSTRFCENSIRMCLRDASVNPRDRVRCELEIGYRDAATAIAVSSAKVDGNLSYVNSLINVGAWVSVYINPGREITPQGISYSRSDTTLRPEITPTGPRAALLGPETFLICFD